MSDDKLKYAKEDTSLAKKRTMLAGVRTLLSHIRTSIVILSLAFAFMKLDKNNPIDALTIVLFVLSGVFLIIGVIDFFATKKYVGEI